MSSFPPFYILLKHCGLFVTNWTLRMMLTVDGLTNNQLDKLENMDAPMTTMIDPNSIWDYLLISMIISNFPCPFVHLKSIYEKEAPKLHVPLPAL